MPKSEKEQRAIDEIKTAASEGVGVEGTELTDESLEDVSGGCQCMCGIALDCGGGGGGTQLE